VPGDLKEVSSQATTAEGNRSFKDLATFKSKNIPVPPV
jgi:hypothetical protein